LLSLIADLTVDEWRGAGLWIGQFFGGSAWQAIEVS
jgi:hypothetical protein